MGDSVVKNKLRSLCCGNGWSYGIFWRYDKKNSMFLTFDDAYYEEQMGEVIGSLLLQVHMLGEGIVGQVALTGRQQWLFYDAQSRDWQSTCDNKDVFKDSMFDFQISCGVKTNAVISVEPWGVLQFGSTRKILESVEFLNQTQMLFQDGAYADGLLPFHTAPSHSECGANDNSGLLDSVVTSGNYVDRNHGGEHSQTSSFSRIQHDRMDSTLGEPSHTKSQQQIMCAESQVLFSDQPSTESQQLLTRPVFPSSPTALSCEGSIITSLQSHLSSEMILPHADLPSTGAISPAFCGGTVHEFQNDSTFNRLDSLGELFSTENFEGDSFHNPIPSSLLTSSIVDIDIFPDTTTSELDFPEGNKPTDFIEDLSEFFNMDDLSQWFSESPSHGKCGTETLLDNTYSQSAGVSSISSTVAEADLSIDTPLTHTANSMQSFITDTSDSSVQEKFFHVNATSSNMSTAIGINHEQVKAVEFCKNQVMPIETVTHSAITAAESDCVSELITCSVASQRGLFSELGIDELLGGIANSSSATSSFEYGPSTTKRRKIERSLVNCGQVELGSLPFSLGRLTSIHDRERSNLMPKKESLRKSQVGLWIDDSYSINVGTGVGAKPKRDEEPTKVSRRRARPGESNRPRPKDRQQIQDRIKELRGMVPNGQKSSIDSLLDRTIKYMLFLQSVTKYADKLLQADEPKLIDHEDGVILKDGYIDSGNRGATWAYEVGSQTTVCPIIVEDLSPPGQMLIEMLCEDRGFFLEIADAVQGIGLNILKGMMEVQGTKIRARFTVEAQRHVRRMDIFWSLVQLLQDTAASGVDTTNQPKNTTNIQLPLLSSYQQQPLVSLPIS